MIYKKPFSFLYNSGVCSVFSVENCKASSLVSSFAFNCSKIEIRVTHMLVLPGILLFRDKILEGINRGS